MKKNERGFSLVELMVTMVVFVFVLVAAAQIFTALLTQFKQQSKIGETDIEGAVGLEIMRYDLAHAGYALPWNVQGGDWTQAPYSEVPAAYNFTTKKTDGSALTVYPSAYNDAGGPPRAIYGGSNLDINGDYLVIRSAVAATNNAAGKSINLQSAGITPAAGWTPPNQNVNVNSDGTTNNKVRIIVLSPGTDQSTWHSLVLDGGNNWCTTYTDIGGGGSAHCSHSGTGGFAPSDAYTTNVIYGIDSDTDLNMPFNRADYYISTPATMPARCASNTGILYKGTVNQADGNITPLPLLDCVAYMHVDYWLDTNNDGIVDTIADDISGKSALDIRKQLQEVRVYIIAQEGQKDANYDFSNNGARTNFSVLESLGSASRTVSLPSVGTMSTLVSPDGTKPNDYKRYRWKLYTLVVQPNSLR
jgi:prepilin-type N-terminal cleavage/methylation domain-containing protein